MTDKPPTTKETIDEMYHFAECSPTREKIIDSHTRARVLAALEGVAEKIKRMDPDGRYEEAEDIVRRQMEEYK